MIDTDVMAWIGPEGDVLAGRAEQKLGVVARGLDAHGRAGLAGRPRARRGRPAPACGDRHGGVPPRVARRRRRRRGRGRPREALVDIARLLPAGEVSIEHRAEEESSGVECGSATYSPEQLQVEDFPRLLEVEGLPTFSVERKALLETVSRVSRSASRDESRPVLTGILVRFESGKLVMAATDSYRLAVKETSLESARRRSSRRSSRRGARRAGPDRAIRRERRGRPFTRTGPCSARTGSC